ncbi:protein FAM170A-like isoform X1 [Canis lupus baileyi]|uniref:protein FAM170A-like isoform X1 n=1 Tax=Canis lupus baileyi TaxID=143281 RepID=UPI003B96AA7A
MKQRQKRKHLENEESSGTAKQGGGVSKSQEDAPQVESTGEAKGWGAGVEEVSSASEYFSCVSSPLELIHSGLWRVHRDSPQPRSPLAQVQERGETAPPSHHVSSSPSSYKTCVSSLYINKKERGMKIHYMQVQMRKGVAVSWETEETSESVEKQPRLEEVTLPEAVRGPAGRRPWAGSAQEEGEPSEAARPGPRGRPRKTSAPSDPGAGARAAGFILRRTRTIEIHEPEDPRRWCGLLLGEGEKETTGRVADRMPMM